jgi:hypothetical protein
MKTHSSTRAALWLGLLLLCGSLQLRAEQFRRFTYGVVYNGNTVEITGYPRVATGPVEVPATIAGTGIHMGAFASCTGVTSVTIPFAAWKIHVKRPGTTEE